MINYYEYLIGLIVDKDIWDQSKYSKLLTILYADKFDIESVHYLDFRHIRDVVTVVRDSFLNTDDAIEIDEKCFNQFNYLEVLVGIAIDTAQKLHYIIAKTFFEMLNSLYIDAYDDEHFDEKRILRNLKNWNRYEYDDFGNGNIFRFEKSVPHLREYCILEQIEMYKERSINE